MRPSLFLVLVLALATPCLAQPCPPCPGDTDPPVPDGPQVFFGYLHAHTSYSDGVGSPEEAYAQARDQGGMDYLVLSPHNHRHAGMIATQPALYDGDGDDALINIAAAVSEEGRFIALYGQEFSSISQGNHVNVVDAPTVIGIANGEFDELVDDYLPNNLDSTGNTPLLVLNHPDSGPRNREYGRDDFGSEEEWVRTVDRHASIINLINGPSTGTGRQPIPDAEEGSLRFFLNRGFHLAPSIDQDNHERTWGTIHDGRTAVVAPTLTKEAVLTALRSRHAYATTDRNLRVVCRFQDGLCGDVFAAPAEGTELEISFDIRDDDEPAAVYQVTVFSDEVGGRPVDFDDPIEQVLFEGDGTLSIPHLRYLGGNAYFLFRITQFAVDDDTGDDADQVWLAPVWFEPPNAAEMLSAALAEPATPHAVARGGSELFHVEGCPIIEGVPAGERVRGREAVVGRSPHPSCVGHGDGR